MEKENKTEYKNDNISINVLREPGCVVKLEIDVTPKASHAAWSKAIKIINKEVSLPGFRKGKAPTELIEKQYSKYVDQEWRDCLIQTSFEEALKLTKIYPLNKETIKKPQIKNASKEEGSKIFIEFETSPEIPEIVPKDLKIQSIKIDEITQKDLDNSMDNIRLQQAIWEDANSRSIQPSDYVDLTIEDIDNPGHFLCKEMRFEVSNEKMGKWLVDLVLGKKVNDVVEGVSEKSEDIDPNIEFKPTNCRITVNAIKTAKLPEINDDLAKKVGADNVDDLLVKIRENLEKQSQGKAQTILRSRLEEKLIETYPFDVPLSLMQSEIKNRIQYVKSELEKSKKSKEEIKQSLSEMQSKIELDIVNSLRMFFIARHLADIYSIEVNKDELVRELMMQLYSKGSPPDASIDSEEARNKVYMDLLSQKVKDNLLEKVVIE